MWFRSISSSTLTSARLSLLWGSSNFAPVASGAAEPVLKHECRVEDEGICWPPLPFIEQSHPMPTMKPLPHYVSVCQDEAQADAPPIIHSSYSDILMWQTGTCLWMNVNTHKQAGRSLWSGPGDSWCLLIVPVDAKCWAHWNAFTSKQHLQNRWPASGWFWISDTVGTSVAFLLDRLVF